MEINGKLSKLAALEALANRAKAEIGKVDSKVTALSSRVDDLTAAGGEPNVITEIKNNGTALPVTNKGVDIGPAIAGAVAEADHLKRKKVDSLDAIDLEAADAAQYIYMVPKTGGKNGDKYDEYMVLDGALEPVGDWKVDLSGYQEKKEGKDLSSNDYTDEEKAKLAGLEIASDEEVQTMLDRVFGAAEA